MESTLYPQSVDVLEKLAANLDKHGILPANKKHCIDYVKLKQANGVKNTTLVPVTSKLLSLAKHYSQKNFKDVTLEDNTNFLAGLNGWNRREYRKAMLQLFRFVLQLEPGETPPNMKGITATTEPNKIAGSDLLSLAERERMLEVTTDLEEKAMLAIGCYAGPRTGEARALKVGDIVIKGSMVGLAIRQGKMAGRLGPRVVPMVKGAECVKAWLEAHPKRHDREAWFLTSRRKSGNPMSTAEFGNVLRRAARRAGIKRRVYWYLLRHTRANELHIAMPGEKENAIMGHGPEAAKRYSHLNDDNVFQAIAALEGGTTTTVEIDEKDLFVRMLRLAKTNPAKLIELLETAARD